MDVSKELYTLKFSDYIHLHVKVITLISDYLAYKSDDWRSVENITLENFRFHTFAHSESDNWRSVKNITLTLEIFRFHTFACKSDNWRSVVNIT